MAYSTGKHESSPRVPTADSKIGKKTQEDTLDAAVPEQTVATDEAVLEKGGARNAEAGPGTASAVSETATTVSGTADSEPGTAAAEPATAEQSAGVKGDQGRYCTVCTTSYILYTYILLLRTAWPNN
jgi:hypothetical protein